ncbi:MAG: 2,3-bisphosphoglycerate-independent phosphoglycerate mutase [Bacteroidota bacterium]
MNNKALLVILDGWGIGNGTKSDAISQANTPFIDSLNQYAHSTLATSGEEVGLPEGQMGNSEVGHLNIGAGRVVYQDFVLINNEVKTNAISKNKALVDAYSYAKQNNKSIHLIGLVSDGGVHSHTSHLMKLCDVAKDFGLKDVFIHALTDGRDTDPKSGYDFVKNVAEHLKNSVGKFATLSGRYYTMDRDKRWERVKIGYDVLVNGIGKKHTDILKAIEESYAEGKTDEFINPVVFVDENANPIATIKEGDVVICFNFRTDRLRQITTALSQKDFPEFGMKKMNLHYVTLTKYDESFKNVNIMYDKQDLSMTLGEVVSRKGLKQLRIAETEKYAHVTFFFSGGREDIFQGEERVLISSPKVATYDLQPAMSAVEVKDAVVTEINKNKFDFICLNFANADMVGHTGIYPAIIEALETVDYCMKEVVTSAIANKYSVVIIADHGNSDMTINEDGSPNTAHTTNPVPIYVINETTKSVSAGKLSDVAPTILKLMGIEIPKEMTGKVLIKY